MVVIDLKCVVIASFMAEILNLTHIVSKEASLVKVHNMSDQEVEDMVTSLTGIDEIITISPPEVLSIN